jgi:hypothetical protein
MGVCSGSTNLRLAAWSIPASGASHRAAGAPTLDMKPLLESLIVRNLGSSAFVTWGQQGPRVKGVHRAYSKSQREVCKAVP